MTTALVIYPFQDTQTTIRFGIQIVLFLVGVAVAHYFIIKPAMSLHNERRKRTVGNNENARKEQERANKLEHEYFERLKQGAEEARMLRAHEIKATQRAANRLISENQEKANQYVYNVKEKLALEAFQAKSQLPVHVTEVIDLIYKKIGITMAIFFFLGGLFFLHPGANALEGHVGLIQSFWYSIFWPYFQLAIFIAVISFFAKKPLKAILEKNRDDLRARLSEAREAVTLAERKVKNYEEKMLLLQQEVNELKEQNLFDAKVEQDKILFEAQKISQAILQDAQRTAQELIVRGHEEIRRELFTLAVEEVEKRLARTDLSSLDRKLKQEAIDEIQHIH